MKKTGFYIFLLSIVLLSVGYMLNKSFNFEMLARYGILAILLVMIISAFRRGPDRVMNRKASFARIHAESVKSDIRFCNVAANSEALESLVELVDYLKAPEKYIKMGARIPRGILLYGPPGTGKTLLARALAGEANVPFYSMSGSDFVQMYVGVGASRVRDLFSKARKAGNCVIFIDEIDSMGKRRDDTSSDEREQTLNALLSEMSGFKENDGIIVLAATNRPDSLDSALTRPGRFDRRIEVGLPSRAERHEILKLHCKNKPVNPSVDLEAIACDTIRFSGASLENLINEAAIRAARRGSDSIDQADFEHAYYASVAGNDRPVTASKEELTVIALHEAGHAIASLCLLPENRLTRVSILPSSGGAAGYNMTIPPEKTLADREYLYHQIQVLLAGRAAEELINGMDHITSGASDDLSRAAEIASAIVMDLGMADEASVSLRALHKSCQTNSQDGFEKSRRLLEAQYEAVKHLLGENAEVLMLLTEKLFKEETLNNRELRSLLPDFFK